MKQWDVFLISFGCMLIMLSYMMAVPLFLIVSGLALCTIGAWRLKKAKRKRG